MMYIGLDIGGTKILGALYSEAGDVQTTIKRKTKASSGIDKVMKQVSKVLDELIEVLEEKGSVLKGIGVGVPGIIASESVVLFSPNIPFKDFDLGQAIENQYHVPVVVGNDVNVAMYGEWRASRQEEAKNVLGIFVGTGIGGALILDRKLYVGQGGAGEIGHMVVNPGGVVCGCGSHGCLEAYASKTGIQKAIKAGLKKERSSQLKDLMESDGDIISSSSIQKAYDNGDDLAIEVVDRCVLYMGIAIANLIHILHPDLIILGGGVMEAMGETLMPKMIEEAKRHIMVGMMDHVRFKLSTLGDDAGIYGAYQLIRHHEG